jgi:hypothetical protein
MTARHARKNFRNRKKAMTKTNQSRTASYGGKSDSPKARSANGSRVYPVESSRAERTSTTESRDPDSVVEEKQSTLKSDISELKESVKQRVSDETSTVVGAMKDVAERGADLAQGAGEKVAQVSHQVTDKVAEVTHDVSEKVAALSSEVTGKVAEVSHEVTEKVGQAAQDAQAALTRAGRSVVRGVKANPLPVALTGVGLAWLTVSLLRGPSSSDGIDPEKSPSGSGKSGEGKTDKLKDGAAAAAASVQHTASGIVAEASEIATRAGESVSKATQSAQVTAKKVFANVTRAERAVAASINEHPVAFGVAALATGAVIGSVLPRTRLENAWLGEQRDEVLGKASELVRGAVEKVESVASSVADTAESVARKVST